MFAPLLILASLSLAPASAECRWPSPDSPTFIDTGDSRSFIAALPGLPSEQEWPTDGSLNDYRNWVEARINPEPSFQAQQIQEFGVLDRAVNAALLQGQGGRIRPARCLERLLLSFHHAYSPLTLRDTEFRAWILESAGRYRVYFVSSTLRAASGILPREIEARLHADLRKGWRLAIDLHNHPFDLRQSCGLGAAGGFPAPSPQDFLSYQRGSGDEATQYLVTNGYFTGEMSIADVIRAQASEGNWRPNLSALRDDRPAGCALANHR